MKHRKNLYSIVLALMMLISALRPDNGCSTLSENDPPPPNRNEIDIDE